MLLSTQTSEMSPEEILQAGEILANEALEEELQEIEPEAGNEDDSESEETEQGSNASEDLLQIPEAEVNAEADITDATQGFEDLFAQGLLKIEPASGEEVADIEPAAGDSGPRNGFGFQSTFAPTGPEALNAQGALSGTDLTILTTSCCWRAAAFLCSF